MEISQELVGSRTVLTVTIDNTKYALSSMYHDIYPEIWAKGHLSNYKNAKYFVFGLGDATFIKALLKEADEDASIILYEPSPEIFNLYGNQVSDARLRIVTSSDNIAELFCSFISYTDLDGCRVCTYPNYNKIFPSEYMLFSQAAQNAATQTAFAFEMARRHGRLIASNSLENLTALSRGYSLLEIQKIFSKRPDVIIAASGPSLDKDIAHLNDAKKKTILISVDSALPALLSNDIIPDFFISVDPYKELDNFRDERIKDIPGFFPLSSRSVLQKDRTAPSFFYNDNDVFMLELGLPRIGAEGSVSNHAFGVAKFLGARKVIFTGLDLAFSNGKSHSNGALFNGSVQKDDTYIDVATNSGAYAQTNQGMNLYRIFLEQQIDSSVSVITTAYDGAKIGGASYMSMSDALLDCRRIDYCFDNIQNYPGDIISFLSGAIAFQRSFFDAISSYEQIQARATIDSHPMLHYIKASVCENSYEYLRIIDKKDDAQAIDKIYNQYFKNCKDACDFVIHCEESTLNLLKALS